MIFCCYNLNEEKILHGGSIIPGDEELYCVKEEEDILFLLYENKTNDKIFFWARLEEVTFVYEKEKDFKEDIGDIISGNYFNLI